MIWSWKSINHRRQQVDQSGLYAQDWENRFPFEEILHIDGCEYMDICIPIKPVAV